MSTINGIFENLEKLLTIEQKRFLLSSDESEKKKEKYNPYKHVKKITTTINSLSDILERDETILISIKHQKLLRSSFQLIIALGTSQCLIPGVGVNLEKRCAYAEQFNNNNLDDDQKYKILTLCADFFARSYTIPVLKNIICTFHLSDYLASLIQLAFAPLKEPGTYRNYVMTQSRYDQLTSERQKYIAIYENLVQNCFQPFLMKELLVLQSVTEPGAPPFLKLAVTKSLSKRLIAPGGLLSLIRSFLENYGPDTGYDWKKIDSICKIVIANHGILSDTEYVDNMCSQITQILTLTNTRYIMTASACIFSLKEKYKQYEAVKKLTNALFIKFDYIHLLNSTITPGTLLMSSQEIEHNLKILHVSLCVTHLDWAPDMWTNNMFVLFMLGMKSKPTDELTEKIRSIIVKCLETYNKENIYNNIQMLLFGFDGHSNISVDEIETGFVIKYTQEGIFYPNEMALKFFLDIFERCTSTNTIRDIFESCLRLLVDLINKRYEIRKDSSEKIDNHSKLMNDVNEKYAITLQLLSEISSLPKIIATLKSNPEIVLEFIDYFLVKTSDNPNDECIPISLVLLNTVLANIKSKDVRTKFGKLRPFLEKMQYENSEYIRILCQEAIIMISEDSYSTPTALSKAIGNVFDKLLPVRAHGIMEITKLIESKDVETLAKLHYIYCLMQEQLKDSDSYIYLSAINCIAALGAHFPKLVLQFLCIEFMDCHEKDNIKTKESMNRSIEHRVKVGDIIVKVIKRLGNTAVEHKHVLINTMLTTCRDPEPMIRTSALSNLAEVALVINFKLGVIIEEVFICVWSIIKYDDAIECRRAAVMVISSLVKGCGKETLLNLGNKLLVVFETLESLYNDPDEDHILKLHAQIGLEELNSIISAIIVNDIDIKTKLVLEHKAI